MTANPIHGDDVDVKRVIFDDPKVSDIAAWLATLPQDAQFRIEDADTG